MHYIVVDIVGDGYSRLFGKMLIPVTTKVMVADIDRPDSL